MTRPLEIRYLSTAQNDLEDIIQYIKIDNPGAAASMLDELDRSISLLAENPKLGVVPKDVRLQKLGYRVLIVRKYLVFYVRKTDFIQIRRIIHGARRYSFLL